MKTLAAYTELETAYPAYFNISEAGGRIVLTLREKVTSNALQSGVMNCGRTVQASFPREALDQLRSALSTETI